MRRIIAATKKLGRGSGLRRRERIELERNPHLKGGCAEGWASRQRDKGFELEIQGLLFHERCEGTIEAVWFDVCDVVIDEAARSFPLRIPGEGPPVD
jgi:hypothetical protein